MAEDKQNGVIFLKMLGVGSFGQVYTCTFHNKKHVVKKIKKDEGYYNYKMILSEYLVLSELKHPRLLSLVNFYETGRDYNFILPYMSHGSLSEVLQKLKNSNSKLDENDILGMLMDMIIGVQYLHRKGVIHRDLKPGNILLDKDYRCVISDFGIAKLVESHEAVHQTSVGTFNYMAPEVYLCMPYDKTVDNWGLGIIFYEMAMMMFPFAEQDRAKLLNKKMSYQVPKIDFERRKLSPEVQDILNLMLQRDAEKRADLSIVCRVSILKPFYNQVKTEETEYLKKIQPKAQK